MTQLEQLLDVKVFEGIKHDLLRKVQMTNKSDIINSTDDVIEKITKLNNYEPIDIDWNSFDVIGRTTDSFSVDTSHLTQGYYPSDRIVGNIFTFSSTIRNGSKILLDFMSENIYKSRYGIYNLTIEKNSISFSVVIFDNPDDPTSIAKKRDEVKEHLIKAFNDLNLTTIEFKKVIDNLIILEANMLKKRYIDSDNLFKGINGIK